MDEGADRAAPFLLRNSGSEDSDRKPPPSDESSLKQMYRANPLNYPDRGIRLLRLCPGSKSADLEATFAVFDQEGPFPPYEALSYTWGPPAKDSFLRIMRYGEAWKVPITPNLQHALLRLRLQSKPRLIWVDALCIDQDSNEEKTAQIPRMATIYRGAADVCIWLGREADDSELALKFVRQVLNLEYFDRLVHDPRHQKEWLALSALMRRSWFSRRWVIQEIAFARQATLYCGEHWVKWKDFAHVVGLVGVRHHDIRQLFIESSVLDRNSDHAQNITSLAASRLVHTTQNLFHKSDDGEILEPILPLETLVFSLIPFGATRLHDTIYAIIPLATGVRYRKRPVEFEGDGAAQHIDVLTEREKVLARRVIARLANLCKDATYPIDYGKSYFEVCKDFVSFYVRQQKSLDILCRPWAPDDADLPSWVAQLSSAAFRPGVNRADSRVKGDPLVSSPGGGQRIYNAARSVSSSIQFGSERNPKTLSIDGFELDHIGSKTLPAQQGNIPATWTDFAEWKEVSSLPPNHFWRTLVADRGPDGLIPPSYYQLACQHAFDQRTVGGDLVIGDLLRAGMPMIVSEFLERVQSVIFQRRLFRSKDHGLLGLAPSSARKKDLICILYGLSVPVILRPVRSTNSSREFRLIGECYIHGMMNGEAFELRQNGQYVRSTFNIV